MRANGPAEAAHNVPTIWTIGHSTRSADEFVELLRANGINGLADIRTIPRSRRHPHFAREALDARLRDEGIEYRHFAALGGLRKPRPDSPNSAWRNESFRGYADHMMTPEFVAAVEELLVFGEPRSGTWLSCARRPCGGNVTGCCCPTRWSLAAWRCNTS